MKEASRRNESDLIHRLLVSDIWRSSAANSFYRPFALGRARPFGPVTPPCRFRGRAEEFLLSRSWQLLGAPGLW